MWFLHSRFKAIHVSWFSKAITEEDNYCWWRPGFFSSSIGSEFFLFNETFWLLENIIGFWDVVLKLNIIFLKFSTAARSLFHNLYFVFPWSFSINVCSFKQFWFKHLKHKLFKLFINIIICYKYLNSPWNFTSRLAERRYGLGFTHCLKVSNLFSQEGQILEVLNLSKR